MERARRVAVAALAPLVLLGSSMLALAASVGPALLPAAAVAWPSSTLVISEVVTGGASASDEFVEIANQGAAAVDLSGLEIAYVTSTGGTVTRKASWTVATVLEPGRRLLIANSLGSFAAVADATYSGGFAATGGSLVLRVVGGAPVDAVGWGDATNGFVEGSPAPAPPAGSSIERRPGGLDGNAIDTNDNALDWFVQAAPSPQNLAAPSVPAGPPPTAAPTPGAEPTPTTAPTPEPTAEPTIEPSAEPTPRPSSDPTPDPTPDPSSTPDATPTPTSPPTPDPTGTPTPAPTPSPSPAPTPAPSPSPTPTPGPTSTPAPALPIADARRLPSGATATVHGVLTIPLGSLESGRGGFVEDGSAGIAIYLEAAATSTWPAGTMVRLSGVVDDRFAQRTIRVAEGSIVAEGDGVLPAPPLVASGAASEPFEGRRVEVVGNIVGSASTLADGTGLYLDDGSGEVRIVVAPDALGATPPPSGSRVRAVGPLGQRDSSGTGSAGYRIHVVLPGDFSVLPPDPSPSPGPTATPAPTASPSPTSSPTMPPDSSPTPSPGPTPAPTSSPAPSDPAATPIAEARARSVGTVVTVRGVVTAEAGRLGLPPLIAIQDESGGIVVRLPDGVAAPARGSLLRVRGELADPYGQLELRPRGDGVSVLGSASLPPASPIEAGSLGEGVEGRLVTVAGRLESRARKATSGDLTIELVTASGSVRLLTDASSGLTQDSFPTGVQIDITGVAGQRASRKGALDGYRVWIRDAADVQLATNGAGASAGAGSAAITLIAIALGSGGANVTVEGTVTAGVALLDASGRRVVIQDDTAAIEVLLPADADAVVRGARVRVAGTVGVAYGAPRLKATGIEVRGGGAMPSPLALGRAPSAAEEWRLARVAGRVVDVRRLGDRWVAEIEMGGVRIPIVGLPGSGIPATALAEGRAATIVGIVRRPYPSATDRRFALVPRDMLDVAVGPASRGTGAGSMGGPAGPSRFGADGSPVRPSLPPFVDADLGQLAEHVGVVVRVGGLVIELTKDGMLLDDGTAIGRVDLLDEAAVFLPLLEIDDALNAIGTVEDRDGEFVVVVRDGGGLLRIGALGEAVPIAASATAGPVPSEAGVRLGGVDGVVGPQALGLTGFASLLGVTAASVAVWLARRERARRRLAAHVVARLQAFARPVTDGDPRLPDGRATSTDGASGSPIGR